MTDKKHKILEAALELFANDGFAPTSTSKVAKMAGVSEGLIFRHFQNKNGLLKALLEEGESAARILFADIVMETNPDKVIENTLNIGMKVNSNPELKRFWKLQYKLKWETENYGMQKIEPLRDALIRAFKKKYHPYPEKEADLLLVIIDGLATQMFLSPGYDMLESINYLKTKYQ